VQITGDLNACVLAKQFKLSGANIRNIALSAAFLAAPDTSVITNTHLNHGMQREYQKLGKTLKGT
jgi:hypothetical protein